MRLTNVNNRLYLESQHGLQDIEVASGGSFGADPQAVYDEWPRFSAWAATTNFRDAAPPMPAPSPSEIGSPAPRPRQIFAVGLNYMEHASESGFDLPTNPVIFTKFASSVSGPYAEVTLPRGSVDWEVELVVIIGRGGRDISDVEAWHHVAGVSVGQDLSERQLQHSGPAPQFSLAKSHAGFSPIGPSLVTLDELDDPDDLELGCSINGDPVQNGRTRNLIFPVPDLIARLSQTVELLPGDVIFTGTPSGVGAGRTPPRFLEPGDVLTSWVRGIGSLEQRLVAAPAFMPRGDIQQAGV